MAAVFVTLKGGDVFKTVAGVSHLIKVPKIDDILGKTGLALYTQVNVQLAETLQYFLTFDDVIKFIHFGKGLGNIVVEGMMFSKRDSDIPGIPKFFQAFSALRGKKETITIGSEAFTVVIASANITLVGDPDTMAMFQIVFTVIDHKL
jgi:hypothetical protein